MTIAFTSLNAQNYVVWLFIQKLIHHVYILALYRVGSYSLPGDSMGVVSKFFFFQDLFKSLLNLTKAMFCQSIRPLNLLAYSHPIFALASLKLFNQLQLRKDCFFLVKCYFPDLSILKKNQKSKEDILDLFCDDTISLCKQLFQTINNSDIETCFDREGEIDGWHLTA